MFTFKFFIPSLLAVVSAAPFYGTVLERDEQSLETYDYIIIGAGTAGLTVANRLTENPRITVLVLEAGGLDPQNCDAILQRCLGGLANSEFDWGISTVPQEALGPTNAVQRLYLGKAVGGSSLLNGMMFDRPSPSDIDAWEELGNPGWNWKGLLPYYKKSEKFTPPSAEQIAEFGITYDPTAHGYDGHIESSYPNYLYPHTKNFQDALKTLGVPYSTDQARSAIGAFWSPNNLEHVNQTRSYARSGQYEPYKQRKNFHVLTGRHVTKLLSETRAGKVEITGVEYATSKTSARLLARAKKEYILSAGTVHDPQILQLSGIGPAPLLKSKKIPVVVDLPGVGSNLQDHPFALVELELDVPHHVIDLDRDPVWDAEAKELYYTNRTGPWTAGGPNSVAFLPLSTYSTRSQSLLQSYSKQSPAQYLRSGIDKRVIAGHTKQRSILLNRLATSNMAAMEFIWISGAARFYEEPLMLSVQHPFSRGFVEINTTDPFTAPVVDLRTGSNPMDVDMYIDAVRFSRKILATPAIQSLDPVELSPGPEVTTDSELREFTKNGLTTMFHPAGTSAMQKREFGGVVDSELKVYGTSNLRVVDASIMPVIVAAHLQATTYAIAEKAADMIKAAQA